MKATILDPFAGSGTTLIAATLTGRNSIGIELNHNYITIALNRIQKECPLFCNVKTINYENPYPDQKKEQQKNTSLVPPLFL